MSRHPIDNQPSLTPRAVLTAQLPALRSYAGHPAARDDTILRVSLPPAYAACPNPFIAGVRSPDPGQDDYRRGPFAADVSEGRNDPLYAGQVYHTKVPPRAIARYIEHFTAPGDVVFDGFCGSGMTGVAARLTGRRAILVDLSPAATAIAAAYCLPVDTDAAAAAFREVLERLRRECSWLYTDTAGREMEYVIWSEVYRCPHCQVASAFSEMGFDFATKRPTRTIVCPHCRSAIRPQDLARVVDETGMTAEMVVRARHVGDRRDGPPDVADLELARRVQEAEVPFWYPETWMMGRPPSQDGWGDMWRRGYHKGVLRVSDFYARRSLHAIAAALHFAWELDCAPETRHLVVQTVINASINLTKMRRAYQPPVPLVLYLPRLRRECNVIRVLEKRFATTLKAVAALPPESQVMISTQSSTSLPNIPDDCVDYIFTDPPFGQNIIYSEVNFLWESWLGITTAQEPEAIISDGQKKSADDYRDLMRQCFCEFRRILKPGRWMTVEFHNSKNEVWHAIQDALESAGFVVEDVRVLDKQQVSFKQASTENAVQRDLAISARKATAREAARTPHGEEEPHVWEFVAQYLSDAEGAEPDRATLYSRVVQHWLAHGWRVPMDADAFYRGLREMYPQAR